MATNEPTTRLDPLEDGPVAATGDNRTLCTTERESPNNPLPADLYAGMLDALTSHIVLIDDQGIIRYCNERWSAFAAINGAPDDDSCGVGANYLAICAEARGPGSEHAERARAGIVRVLYGETDYFEMEYACDSPREERWFMLRASPYRFGDQRWAVISHANTTAQRQTEAAARELQDRAAAVEKGQAELRSLESLSGPQGMAVAAALFGAKSLRESVPDAFDEFVRLYRDLLSAALEQRIYKLDLDLSEKLRAMGEHLGHFNARPRDIVELHTNALKGCLRDSNASRAQAFVEEGRLMVLELMGYLASYYRTYAIGIHRSETPRS